MQLGLLNLNLDIRCGHISQLDVTGRNEAGPESAPKLDLFFCSHEKMTVRYRTSSVHTRMERYAYRFCSHENGTVRYRTVPISGSLFRTAQFLDLFWNGPLDFFCIRVNATPLRTTFWAGMERYDIVPVEDL